MERGGDDEGLGDGRTDGRTERGPAGRPMTGADTGAAVPRGSIGWKMTAVISWDMDGGERLLVRRPDRRLPAVDY